MKRFFIFLLLTVCVTAGNAWCQDKLALNNGVKWKVDKVTGANVAALQAIVKEAAGTGNLMHYKKAGGALQKGIAKMIRECRVKGVDHQALHHWLEPLIEQLSLMNQAEGARTAEKAYITITIRLKLFDQYFTV